MSVNFPSITIYNIVFSNIGSISTSDASCAERTAYNNDEMEYIDDNAIVPSGYLIRAGGFNPPQYHPIKSVSMTIKSITYRPFPYNQSSQIVCKEMKVDIDYNISSRYMYSNAINRSIIPQCEQCELQVNKQRGDECFHVVHICVHWNHSSYYSKIYVILNKIRVMKLIAGKLNDIGFQTDVNIECTSVSGTDSKHMKT